MAICVGIRDLRDFWAYSVKPFCDQSGIAEMNRRVRTNTPVHETKLGAPEPFGMRPIAIVLVLAAYQPPDA